MPDKLSHLDNFDFAGEMQALASQAEGKASGAVRMDQNDLVLALGKMLRPLAFELEAVKRGNSELGQMLIALGKTLNTAPTPSTTPQVSPQTMDGIAQQLQRLGSVESANQKLFDALHAELKGYKDNFLFDALQKPFIRDMVSLFDDLNAVHEQTLQRLAALKDKAPKGNDETAFLQNLAGNVENQVHHMIEVFLRMDVTISRTAVGAPIDKKVHRIVSFEPVDNHDDDGTVARSIKPGFGWRDRPIRPEEIVARRWKSPAAPAAPAAPNTSKLPPASPAAPDDTPATPGTSTLSATTDDAPIPPNPA